MIIRVIETLVKEQYPPFDENDTTYKKGLSINDIVQMMEDAVSGKENPTFFFGYEKELCFAYDREETPEEEEKRKTRYQLSQDICARQLERMIEQHGKKFIEEFLELKANVS